jgi:streptogramin lyase
MRQPPRAFAAAAFAALCFACVESARADVFALDTVGGPGPGIVRFDSAGRFAQRIPVGGESADGLAVTPDGYVYVAGNVLGQGTFDRARVPGPIHFQHVDSPPSYNIPIGLEAGPDGSVYATSTRFRAEGVSGVFRYNPADDTFLPVVTIADSPAPPRTFNYDVALAPGGDLYLLRGGVGVERFSGASGASLGVVIPAAALPANTPEIDFGPDGNLYVPSSAGVDRYSPQTGALIDHFIPNGAGGLNGANSIAFGGDRLLYVNSPAARSILRFDPVTGAFRDVFVTPEQYTLASPFGGISQIAWAVPEPGGAGIVMGVVAVLAARRRRKR